MECGEFKDTNDEVVCVGILFSTTQKLKKKKNEFFGDIYGLHMSSRGGHLATTGPPSFWDICYVTGAAGLVLNIEIPCRNNKNFLLKRRN